MTTFMRSGMGLIVPIANPHNIADSSDFCGLSIGAVRASLQEHAMNNASDRCGAEGKPAVNINLFTDQTQVIAAIGAGKLDGFLGGALQSGVMAKTFGNGSELTAIDPNLPTDAVAIASDKKRPGLSAAFQAALREIIRTGEYRRILEGYSAERFALDADAVTVNGPTEWEF